MSSRASRVAHRASLGSPRDLRSCSWHPDPSWGHTRYCSGLHSSSSESFGAQRTTDLGGILRTSRVCLARGYGCVVSSLADVDLRMKSGSRAMRFGRDVWLEHSPGSV